MTALDQTFTVKSQAAAALALLQSCPAYEQAEQLPQVGALLHDLGAKLDALTAALDT